MQGITPGWRFVSIGFEDDPIDIAGINPWHHQWTALDQGPITVAHPSYPHQRHPMNIYQVQTAQTAVVFAAGEFSNGVWGFFTPNLDDQERR